jgi:hypothetical protein
MTTPNLWHIIAPGVLELSLTRFRICYVPDSTTPYQVEHDGHPKGGSGTLQGAKNHTMHLMNELLLMGIEP